MTDGTAVVLLILGLVALGVLRTYFQNRYRLRLREMAHRERMLAMEKGLPGEDLAEGAGVEAWLDGGRDPLLERGWDRTITLALGLVMLFASIGALLFAWLTPPVTDDAVSLKIAAGLAVIPLMAALGLLLYYWLTAPARG